MAALAAKGYRLAHGRKRLVVIDPHGKTHNPVRNLKGVRSLEFIARLRDLDFDRLPDARAAFSKAQTVNPERETRWKSVDQLAQLQSERQEKHRLEYECAHLQHARQVQSAKSTLADYYELPKRKKQLLQLKTKIDRASWWQRLIGTTRRDRKMLLEQVTAYKFYVSSYRKKIARIETDSRESLIKLQERQRKEIMGLKLQIDRG